MDHEHEDCGSNERVWLPINDESATVARHPYCKHCGVVRNLSRDRATGIGYFMNVLALMKRKGKAVTNSQIRLISKELMEMDDFEDKYWMKKSIQENIFIKTVKKYCNFSQNYIQSFL
jgi:hypothetical protein